MTAEVPKAVKQRLMIKQAEVQHALTREAKKPVCPEERARDSICCVCC